jgi:enterochelin esterase-like enzyme
MRVRRRLGRATAVLVALGVLVVGLGGAYSYWESYYQHRGFQTVALVAGAHPGRLVAVDFYSQALHRGADYMAYLPPGYDPARRRYPVYYLLHGSPGRPEVFVTIANMGLRMDDLVARHRMQPMILVYPDGRIDGSTYSDSEWANSPSGAYMSYVIDVVNDVDHRFATIDNRAARVIAGFSEGAYGAANIALHNLAIFGAMQAWSGYFLETRSGVFADARSAVLASNSPLEYVHRLGPALAVDPLRAFLFIGRDDNSSRQTAPMARALAADGARVSYALYPGGHDWQLWHAHLNQMLLLASREVGERPRAGDGHARTLTPGVTPIPHGLGRHHREPARDGRAHRRPRTHGAGVGGARGGNATGGAPQIAAILGADIDRGAGLWEMPAGLLLALLSAALINLGFLLQHRGLADREPRRTLRATLAAAVRTPAWIGGQLIGWVGFGAQIVAVALAPLALVQAFAAGGLALSLPLAAGLFSCPIGRAQLRAVLVIAVSLALLPIGFANARDHLDGGALAVCAVVAAFAGAALCVVRVAVARAIAAGIFYGIADAAIKAVAAGWYVHGASAVASPWTALAAVATFVGFLAFQSALGAGSPVGAISSMTALTAVVALLCGVVAFGESLGTSPAAIAIHLAAIAVVLGCVPVLAAAHAELAAGGEYASSPDAPFPLHPGYGAPG